MRENSQYDLNILSSTLLGLFGVSTLLIPSRLLPVMSTTPGWVGASIGFAIYILGITIQITNVTKKTNGYRNGLVITAGMSLISLAIILCIYGAVEEATIFFFTGISQLILETSFAKKIEKIGTLNSISIASELTVGLLLTIDRRIIFHSISPIWQNLFIASFFIAGGIGILSIFISNARLKGLFVRVQLIPWIIWCAVFITSSIANVLPPALLVIFAASSKILSWDRMTLPEDDILGRRVLSIGGTLNLTLLIFLSALLFITDQAVSTSFILTVREAAFLFFIIVSAMSYYQVSTIIMTVNGLMNELTRVDEEPVDEFEHPASWSERLNRYIKPFISTREGERIRMNAQAEKIEKLKNQLNLEKKRNSQLTLLNELSQQLENRLDHPVSAQLTVNTLKHALECSLVSLYIHEPDEKEFMLLAAAGEQTSIVPSGYRQSVSTGVIGRAMRHRKTQIINDIRLDKDYIPFPKEHSLSCVIIPMISNGHVNGMIVLNSDKANAFGSSDIGLAEAVASELVRAWESTGYRLRLMDLVQSGSQLAVIFDPYVAATEVAGFTRKILDARFTYVYTQLGQDAYLVQSGSSGDAPELLESLTKTKQAAELIHMARNATQPFRIRDVRKYASTSDLNIDHPNLRSMLAIPIRWRKLNIGVILAFGKHNEVFFNENDESLAELISIQAAGTFESTWLQHEVRTSLRSTSLLFRLSTQVLTAETIQDAADYIANTTHKLVKGISTGILLYSADGKVEADLTIDSPGNTKNYTHPMDMIKEVLETGQPFYVGLDQTNTRACLPVQTPIRKYGALWTIIPEDSIQKSSNPADIQTLANQSAIALERSILLAESRRQAREIKIAYDTLEATYDQTLAALSSALDARDRETEGHSMRVSNLSGKLGEALGFSAQQLKVLERGSLLHDIGKIGISDTILHKPGPLSEDEWKIMRLHPDIGARIVEGIPFLEDTIPLIRHHQERWDGSGYPGALKGEEIPLLARMFSIVDAFDALTSNRPYRTKISTEEALEYISEQAGTLFDPHIAQVFRKMVYENINQLQIG